MRAKNQCATRAATTKARLTTPHNTHTSGTIQPVRLLAEGIMVFNPCTAANQVACMSATRARSTQGLSQAGMGHCPSACAALPQPFGDRIEKLGNALPGLS